MPAHCGSNIEGKSLSNGQELTEADVRGNDYVDTLAKQIARRDRAPRDQVARVSSAGQRLQSIAMWIGQATALANHFPDPRVQDPGARARGVYYPAGFTNLCEAPLKVGITMDSKMAKL